MPQLQEKNVLFVMRHLLCPTCLKPMHIGTAEVTADGRAKIQFVCDSCGAQTDVRQY